MGKNPEFLRCLQIYRHRGASMSRVARMMNVSAKSVAFANWVLAAGHEQVIAAVEAIYSPMEGE